MRTIIFAAAILSALTVQAFANTRVWGFYGLGDNFFGTSSGIDQIAARARTMPHVTSVHVLRYWEMQRAADEIMAAPRTDRIVLYGYSCGGNAITTIGYALHGHRHIEIAAIQPSLWCGGHPITSNVTYAQQTYAGCIATLGFGCKQFRLAPGSTSEIVRIHRRQLHIWADTDPHAQEDVLHVIAGAHSRAAHHGAAVEVIR